jgi:hypothetical protein
VPDFSALFANAEAPPEAVEMVKKLSYALGSGRYFSDPEVVHSAVYIAAGLVFAKKGINFAKPWILMRIPNMRAVFSDVEEPRIVF